jgi:hypothetical protein
MKDKEADFRSDDTSRSSEEGVQLLWTPTYDVRHVLLQKV